MYSFLTDPFRILEPQDQEIGEFYSVQELRPADFDAQTCKRVGRVSQPA